MFFVIFRYRIKINNFNHNHCRCEAKKLHPGHGDDLGWLIVMAAIVRLSSVCRRGVNREYFCLFTPFPVLLRARPFKSSRCSLSRVNFNELAKVCSVRTNYADFSVRNNSDIPDFINI